jgi:hypothetical protein
MKRQKLMLASLAAAFTPVVWSVPTSADVGYSNLGSDNRYSTSGTVVQST